MSLTPRLSLETWPSGIAQADVPANNNVRRLDATVNAAVLSNVIADQPVSPVTGDSYILPASATGAQWAGQPAGTIAYYDGAWSFYAPVPGMIVQVKNGAAPFWLRYQSGEWLTESQSLDAELSQVIGGTAGTGLVSFGGLSINANPALFDVGEVDAWYVDNTTNPTAPIRTRAVFAAQSGITVTNIATAIATYVGINVSGVIVQQTTPFSAAQSRSIVQLGVLAHANHTSILLASNRPQVTLSPSNQLQDVLRALGTVSINGGNKISANGANLALNRAAGMILREGVGFVSDHTSPHNISLAAQTAATFRYRLRDGSESADVTAVIPGSYDNAGAVGTVPANNFTIQRVYLFPGGAMRILYGQTLYATMDAAVAEIRNESFVIDPATEDNGTLRAWLVLRNTTTSLQNATDARIISANRFGL